MDRSGNGCRRGVAIGSGGAFEGKTELVPILHVMDSLISAAVGLQQAKVTSQIQYAVARKLLDSQQQQGAAVVKLINAASQGIKQSGDELVAAATGLGGSLDTYG